MSSKKNKQQTFIRLSPLGPERATAESRVFLARCFQKPSRLPYRNASNTSTIPTIAARKAAVRNTGIPNAYNGT